MTGIPLMAASMATRPNVSRIWLGMTTARASRQSLAMSALGLHPVSSTSGKSQRITEASGPDPIIRKGAPAKCAARARCMTPLSCSSRPTNSSRWLRSAVTRDGSHGCAGLRSTRIARRSMAFARSGTMPSCTAITVAEVSRRFIVNWRMAVRATIQSLCA